MNENNRNEKKIIIVSAIVLVVLIALLGTVYYFSNRGSLSESSTKGSYSDSQELKSYSVEIIDNDNQVREYSGETKGKYLIDVMDELSEQGDFSYESKDSVYGVFITAINGVRTEDITEAYWAFYVNDMYCQHGVSTQPVCDGDKFKIQYEEIG